MSDNGQEEVAAAILTSAILRGNPKPHAKIALDTYKIVLEGLRAESRPKSETTAQVSGEPAPPVVAAAEATPIDG